MTDHFFLLGGIFLFFILLFLFVLFIVYMKRLARSLRSIETSFSTLFSATSQTLDHLERKLHEHLLETRDLGMRITIVETRLEELSLIHNDNRALLTAKPKRGRPRKVDQE